MKKCLLIICILFSQSVLASDRVEVYEYCETLSRNAYKLMKLRQSGVSMSKVLRLLDDNTGAELEGNLSDEDTLILEKIIFATWSQALMVTEVNKIKQADNWKNEIETQCIINRLN